MKALAPGFLIAMPQLADSNFEKTVVLMIEHSTDGAMGLVINRPAPVTFAEIADTQKLDIAPSRENDSLFLGGPVQTFRGFVLHDSPKVEEKLEVIPGLFLSVTSDALTPLLLDPTVKLRFCLGYSGWGAGQIEQELSTGSWLYTEATSAGVLLTEPEALWEQTIKSMGFDPAMLVTTGGIN